MNYVGKKYIANSVKTNEAPAKFIPLKMLQKINIAQIYIVHAKKGYEKHEQRINEIFGRMNLTYEFVSDGDVSNFDEAILNKYFCADIKNHLSDGVLSCTLNHILCYKKMVERQQKYALVFENDPFFLGDFLKKMKKIMAEITTLPSGFIISLENTTLEFPRTKDLRKGQHLYEADHGRCAGAYLIDLEAASNILENLKTNKCCQVIDWWHNTLISNKIIKMYWADPVLIEQGSHNGRMSSTISTNNKNIARRISWLAQKYYKTYFHRFLK